MATCENLHLKPGDLFVHTNKAGVWVMGTVHEIDSQKGVMTGWVQRSSLRVGADIDELYPEGEIKISLQDQGLSQLPDPRGQGK